MTSPSLVVSYNFYFITKLKNKIIVFSREGKSAEILENSKINRFQHLGFTNKETGSERLCNIPMFTKKGSKEPRLNSGVFGSRDKVFIHCIIPTLPILHGLKHYLKKKYYQMLIGCFLCTRYWS